MPSKLVGIQTLRFIAAFMVVLTHTTLMIGERIYGVGDAAVWREGNAGVDIFFVISGYVMALSSAPLIGQAYAAREFITRRLIRIVPLYWVATTLKLLAVLAVPAWTLHSVFDPSHVIASYLFLPWRNVENEFKPLIGVGWTLTFEMFFYALFAIALLVRRDPLRILLPILIALALLGLDKSEDAGPWSYYLDPILLEFGMGLIAARLISRGFRVTPVVGLAVIAAAFACFFIPSEMYWSQRAIGWGIPAFLIVLCTAAIEPFLSKHLPGWLSFWGDSSYALYLFHSFYVPVAGVILVKTGYAYDWLAFLVAVIGSIVLGAVVHRWLELPLGAKIKSLRKGTKRPAQQPLRSRSAPRAHTVAGAPRET